MSKGDFSLTVRLSQRGGWVWEVEQVEKTGGGCRLFESENSTWPTNYVYGREKTFEAAAIRGAACLAQNLARGIVAELGEAFADVAPSVTVTRFN